MMKYVGRLIVCCAVALMPGLTTAAAQECQDNPLFTRMPNYHVYECEASEFDARQIPIDVDADGEPVLETVEGAYSYVTYELDEGAKAASPLQILRNHLNAAKAAGGTVVKEFGALERMLGDWVNIQQQIATIKFVKDGKETWVHLGSVNSGDYYAIAMVQREAMAQTVSATALLQQIERDGLLTLEVHFDTGKATIQPASATTLDQAAEALKTAPQLVVEIGGHTDNVGSPESNLTLSQQRAESVQAALVERGVPADRLSAKGYGQTAPVADNRTEEGRARNRRVELVRKP